MNIHDHNYAYCEAEFHIPTDRTSGKALLTLINGGEIISGEGANNKRWFLRSTSELLEDAGLEDDERITVEDSDDDGSCYLNLLVRFPERLRQEVRKRAEDGDIRDEAFHFTDEPEPPRWLPPSSAPSLCKNTTPRPPRPPSFEGSMGCPITPAMILRLCVFLIDEIRLRSDDLTGTEQFLDKHCLPVAPVLSWCRDRAITSDHQLVRYVYQIFSDRFAGYLGEKSI